MDRPDSQGIFFKNLDPIRFFAAMMVFFQHALIPPFSKLETLPPILDRLVHTLGDGEMGVSIFFVLSGFLITWLLIAEHDSEGSVSPGKFYLRRILRIWPLYFMVIALSFGLIPFLITTFGEWIPPCSNIWYHLTFLSNFDVYRIQAFCDGNGIPPQNITWSISVEEQFYLIWPLIFLLPRKAWGWVLGVVICGSLAFRSMNLEDPHLLYFHTFSVMIDLGMGALFAWVIRRNGKLKSFLEGTGPAFHLVLLCIIFGFLAIRPDQVFGEVSPVVDRLLTGILFGLIITAQAFSQKAGWMNLHRIPFISYWGKRTYGLYLLHPIALFSTGLLLNAVGFDYRAGFAPFLIWALIGLGVSLALTYLSFRFLERPFLRLKKRFQVVRNRD